jgi:protocatechuate 3,4-dioxygenase beta subunit
MHTPSLLLLVLSAALACAQQQPPAAESAASETQKKEKLCRITGHTLHAQTGGPVRKVKLILHQMRMESKSYSAVSDAEGKFSIDDIEPGTYQLTAERAGFLRQSYGSRRYGFSGTALTLMTGQELKDLEFKLMPQGVITGKVLDEEGEPVRGAFINVTRQAQSSGGRGAGMGGEQANDVGDYRVADLAPGRYIVQANPTPDFWGRQEGVEKSDEVREAHVPTFYPGVTDAASASAVEVGPGQEVSGINITLRRSRVYRVSGTVSGAAAGQLKTMNLSLYPRDRRAMLMFFGAGGARVNADGTFTIGKVQPGSYNLNLMLRGDGRPQVVGRAPVDVGEADVEGVVVRVSQGLTLNGFVRVEGKEKIEISGIRLVLRSADGIGFGMQNAMVKEDGTFRMDGVMPDRYSIGTYNLPEGTYLKSVRLGNQDAPDKSVDLSQAQGSTTIELVLSPNAGTVEGLVTDDEKPAQGISVLLMPDPPIADDPSQAKWANTDQNGRFSIKGVAPGDYKLYASAESLTDVLQDPDALKPFEEKAVKATVREKGREQKELTLLKPEDARPK